MQRMLYLAQRIATPALRRLHCNNSISYDSIVGLTFETSNWRQAILKSMYKAFAVIIVLTIAVYMIADANSSSLKKTTKYLYKISDACEGTNLYIVNHTTEENKKYVSSLAKKVSDDLATLKKYTDQLPDQEPVKAPLQKFVADWTREKIEASLFSGDGRFQSDLGYLKSLIPDKRKKWKTPFPIFKP